MFNIGGGEFLIIFLVALVVLGPTKLPEAARQVGKIIGEFRKVSNSFQTELKSALDDPVERATREMRKDVTSIAQPPPLDDGTPTAAEVHDPLPDAGASPDVEDPNPGDPPMHGDR